MAQSGNRPPRRGQSQNRGARPLSNDSATTDGGRDESAAERARERLAQRNLSGQKRQSASQRARSGGPSSQRAKASPPAARRARSGGAPSRRGSSKNAPKRSTALTAGVFGTVLVVLAVLVIVLVSVTGKTSANGQGLGMEPAPASVVAAISHVPSSAFAEAGSTITSSGPDTAYLTHLKKQPPLTDGGKPLVAYMGSNYCPYCAASRWPLAVALSRFGTFKKLRMTTSGPAPEAYPGTPTLSFYGSTYTSPYVSFLPTEQCTDVPSTSTAGQNCSGYKPLQSLTPMAHKIFFKYDFPPYITSANEGTIPFIDFGNKIIEDGAFMDPSILAGFTQAQIAQSLGNPVASPARPILVSANFYTAAICSLTKNKPGSVCKMPVVVQAAKQLKL